MIKDVLISINSIQGSDREDEDRMEFITDGQFSFDNGVSTLSYMESEVTGLEGTRTKLMIMPDEVVMDRDGCVTSRMVFKEGLKNSFLYNTPYGTATMGVNTHRIRHSFDENGGNMEIDYVVDMEHAVVTRNKFFLKVTEQKHLEDLHG